MLHVLRAIGMIALGAGFLAWDYRNARIIAEYRAQIESMCNATNEALTTLEQPEPRYRLTAAGEAALR